MSNEVNSSLAPCALYYIYRIILLTILYGKEEEKIFSIYVYDKDNLIYEPSPPTPAAPSHSDCAVTHTHSWSYILSSSVILLS